MTFCFFRLLRPSIEHFFAWFCWKSSWKKNQISLFLVDLFLEARKKLTNQSINQFAFLSIIIIISKWIEMMMIIDKKNNGLKKSSYIKNSLFIQSKNSWKHEKVDFSFFFPKKIDQNINRNRKQNIFCFYMPENNRKWMRRGNEIGF